MKKTTFTAYRIYCEATGLSYIGMTKNFKGRLVTHKSRAKAGVQHPLYDDVRTYGWGCCVVTKIATCKTYEQAQELERTLICHHNSLWPNGYNLETGGNLGKRASSYARKRLSESHKGFVPDPKDTAKRAIAMAAAYDKAGGALRSLRSAQFKGIAKTVEHKKAIGAGNKGKVRSPELRQHLKTKTSEFAAAKREWAENNNYTGPLNSITRKMLEGAR